MLASDPFLIFIQRLNALALPYVITGSIASSLYGEPRLTHDVDLVVDLPEDSVGRFRSSFPIAEFYYPAAEVIQIERRRPTRGHFNIVHHETGYKADIYLAGEDPLHRWALLHGRDVRIGELPVRVAPPEYVIIRKLEYHKESGSEKHIRDILGILALTSPIDRAWIEATAESMGLLEVWREVSSEDRRGQD